MLLGAFLVHPIVFALAFAKGFLLGGGGGQIPMASTPTYGIVGYGFDGGMKSVGTLLVVYLFTLGIVPLMLSAVGGMIGYRFRHRLSLKERDRTPTKGRPLTKPSIAWITAVWAAGLLIVEFIAFRVVLQDGILSNEFLIRWVLPSLPVGIWGMGATAAYVRHRSWQVSAGLVITPFLLRILGALGVLPRYGLLLVAMLFLIYAFITHRLQSRHVG